jgi:hypothetical protein
MSESELLEGETGERACLQMYMYKQKKLYKCTCASVT